MSSRRTSDAAALTLQRRAASLLVQAQDELVRQSAELVSSAVVLGLLIQELRAVEAEATELLDTQRGGFREPA